MARTPKALSLSRLINRAGDGDELTDEQWGKLIAVGFAEYAGRLSEDGKRHHAACVAAEKKIRVSRQLRNARATRDYINSSKPYSDN